MRHIKQLTLERPATAQLEPVLEIVGLIQAILSLPAIIFNALASYANAMNQLHSVFGLVIPQKGPAEE